MANFDKRHVPVYMPDRTIVGYAEVRTQGDVTHIDVQVPASSPLAELVKEDLVAFSVMYMGRDRAEEVIANKENKTDGRQEEAVDSGLHDPERGDSIP